MIRAGATTPDFDDLRREMALHHCKWDAQVGDVDALASFPLVLERATWMHLASTAESLAREMVAAERVVLRDRRAREALGVPRAIAPLLERLATEAAASSSRIVRFDFHPTDAGWALSEANSDVPGGFTESSSFTAQMAERHALQPAGDPARAWLDALARHGPRIALLVAPGWLEDAQVVTFLARGLTRRGIEAHVVTPQQVSFRRGVAHVADAPVDAVVRFHQLEWLADLPRSLGWTHYVVGGVTPVLNPAVAIVSESKRFPIACALAGLALPTWDRFLPETREPRSVPFWDGDAWVLKGTFGNTGDEVALRSLLSRAAWTQRALAAALRPRRWAAQRRFRSRAIATPDGPRHVCLGVYTVDGVACGAYARLSPHPRIDFAAADAAVLVEA